MRAYAKEYVSDVVENQGKLLCKHDERPRIVGLLLQNRELYTEGRKSHRGVYAGLDRRILCVLSMVL